MSSSGAGTAGYAHTISDADPSLACGAAVTCWALSTSNAIFQRWAVSASDTVRAGYTEHQICWATRTGWTVFVCHTGGTTS